MTRKTKLLWALSILSLSVVTALLVPKGPEVSCSTTPESGERIPPGCGADEASFRDPRTEWRLLILGGGSIIAASVLLVRKTDRRTT